MIEDGWFRLIRLPPLRVISSIRKFYGQLRLGCETARGPGTRRRAPADTEGCSRAAESFQTKQPRAIAVVIHLFYREMWPELREYLANISIPFDLFISLPGEPAYDATVEDIRKLFPDAVVRRIENRGRDVAPFLEFLNSRALSAYPYACKIHTKKSPHIPNGTLWRRAILDDLLGSRDRIETIIGCFDANPRLGIAGPGSSYLEVDPHAQSNSTRIDELCRALEIEFTPTPFFAGSMFWFRPAALQPLAQLELTPNSFDPELGQLDGTLAHAAERLFTLVARRAGFEICHTGALVQSNADPHETPKIRPAQ